LGDDTGGGVIMLQPIRLQCVTWTPLCVLMQLNVRIFSSNLRNSTYLPERNFCISRVELLHYES